MVRTLDREKVEQAVREGRMLTLTTHAYFSDERDYVDEILNYFLAAAGRPELRDKLAYCVHELANNAKKANTKRVYFAEKELDLNIESEYWVGMRHFREDTIANIDHYLPLLKATGLYIKIQFKLNRDTVMIAIRNNVRLTAIERRKIEEKIVRSRAYADMDEAYASIEDTSEGAGVNHPLLHQRKRGFCLAHHPGIENSTGNRGQRVDTMNMDKLRQEYDTHQRINVSDALSEREESQAAVRYLWSEEKTGAVLFSRLSVDDADAEIQRQMDRFQELGYTVEWKHFSYDTPPDLKERLRLHGFQEEPAEAVMVLEIQQAPANLLQPVTHDIRKATTREEFAHADAIHEAVWGDPPDAVMSRVWPLYQADPAGVSLYLAYVDSAPVSYGRLELPPDNPFGSIWGGTTLPEYRGRGLYTALVATRLQEAARRDRRYLTVDAMPDTSMPILRKRGFLTIGYATAFNWTP